MTERVVHLLRPEDCLRLLRTESVGRLAYVDDDGPVALPFNYTLVDGDIAIRLEPGSTIDALRRDATAAFEVDHIDDSDHTGWSVVVRGRIHELPQDAVPALLHRMGGNFPRPWAAGVHNVWLTLPTENVAGRGLGAPSYDDRVF